MLLKGTIMLTQSVNQNHFLLAPFITAMNVSQEFPTVLMEAVVRSLKENLTPLTYSGKRGYLSVNRLVAVAVDGRGYEKVTCVIACITVLLK